ncbi:hypothetical protein LWI29_004049 [Acer saccharum]|uniref:Uncharacterized protein n=1 Tax=Acer saccharum TaxID=4024 RepID=A0AA39RB90_ACESA|nr:hypothetical protein LWI29_004049 [Acer saccharum]
MEDNKREKNNNQAKRGLWKPEEDLILKNYVETHGEGNWAAVSENSGKRKGIEFDDESGRQEQEQEQEQGENDDDDEYNKKLRRFCDSHQPICNATEDQLLDINEVEENKEKILRYSTSDHSSWKYEMERGGGMVIPGNFILLHFIYCTSSSSSSSHHRPSPSSSSSSSSTITIINHHLPHHPTNPNPDISLSSTTIISKSLFLHSITSGSDDLLLSSLDLDDLNHLDLARSDLHLALTIWICVHLHSRWSGLVLVLRGGGFGFSDCGGGGGGGGLKGCLGFLGFLG